MSQIGISRSGPEETVIKAETEQALQMLEAALGSPSARESISDVVARYPAFLDAWAQLGAHARDQVEAYAAFRVGYHRGLDRLRASGWRGSGYVRWRHEENRGFLRSLAGLAKSAEAIGENEEAERCELFLRQLDPSWPPPSLD